MATELETLVARFEADTKGIRADLSRFTTQLDRVERKAQEVDRSFGRSFRNIALSIGAVVGTRELFRFFSSTVSAASEVEEAANKVGVVFGEASQKVVTFSETTANAFGVAKAEALSAAGDFGNILQASGLVGDAAADMSVELVKLAGDLASFNNLATSDALTKLRAGLAGEAEPLRTVGVLLNESAVKAKAYELGIAAVGTQLTDAEKVQARYALIMEQTATAQGDAARTSGSFANMQRRLAAVWDDMQARLGEGLIPEVERFLGVLLDPGFQRFAESTLGGIIEGVTTLTTAWKTVNESLHSVATAHLRAEEAAGRLAVADARAAARGIELTEAQRELIARGVDFQTVFEGVQITTGEVAEKAEDAASKTGELGKKLGEAGEAGERAGRQIAGGLESAGDAAESAAEKIDKLIAKARAAAASPRAAGLPSAVSATSDVLAQLPSNQRAAVESGRREVFTAASGQLRTRLVLDPPTDPVLLGVLEGTMEGLGPITGPTFEPQVKINPLYGWNDFFKPGGVGDSMVDSFVTRASGQNLDFRTKFVELGGGTRFGTRPLSISGVTAESVMAGVSPISGFTVGDRLRGVSAISAITPESGQQVATTLAALRTDFVGLRALLAEVRDASTQGARSSERTASAAEANVRATLSVSRSLYSPAHGAALTQAVDQSLRRSGLPGIRRSR